MSVDRNGRSLYLLVVYQNVVVNCLDHSTYFQTKLDFALSKHCNVSKPLSVPALSCDHNPVVLKNSVTTFRFRISSHFQIIRMLTGHFPPRPIKAKVKQSHYRLWGFQEVEAPRFQDNRHMNVVRLSDLRIGRLYPQGISWYSFLEETESTPGYMDLSDISGKKKRIPSDTTGDRSRDLPTSSVAP
jgi:hypothetical protein